jgi:uncharacterized protein
MISRFLISKIKFALANSPVLILNGARQSGKSTLMKILQNEGLVSNYETLDSIQTQTNLKNFTEETLRNYPPSTVIDEIQKIPQIFDSIKLVVDENRINSRFILTGSANVLLLPRLSESLAGRVQILTLFPLSVGEILNYQNNQNTTSVQSNIIDDVFDDKIELSLLKYMDNKTTNNDLIRLMVQGGYPELQSKNDPQQWKIWFDSYLSTLLQRDIKDLANIEGLTSLPNMLQLIANQTGSTMNNADMARDLTIGPATFGRYLILLESLFLVQKLLPWYKNIGKRLVKSPKVFINDTGITSHLLNLDSDYINKDRRYFGKLLENLVFAELTKAISFSKDKPSMFFLRTQTGQEIDFVIENGRGETIAIEVKSSQTISQSDTKNLIWFRDNQEDFKLGLILYTGAKSFQVSDRIWAVPASFLWNGF